MKLLDSSVILVRAMTTGRKGPRKAKAIQVQFIRGSGIYDFRA
jgi:hypothetical protein